MARGNHPFILQPCSFLAQKKFKVLSNSYVRWLMLHCLTVAKQGLELHLSVSGSFHQQQRLKEAEEARTLIVAIENIECSGELSKALSGHAAAMTNLYRELHRLSVAGGDEDPAFDPLFAKAAELSAWFKARKKVANSMKQAALAGTADQETS